MGGISSKCIGGYSLVGVGLAIIAILLGLPVAQAEATLEVGTYSAETKVNFNTEIEVSSTKAEMVILTLMTNSAHESENNGAEIKVGTVKVGTLQSYGVRTPFARTSMSFIVPAGKKWEAKELSGALCASEACKLYESHVTVEASGGGGAEGKEGPRGEMLWRGVYSSGTEYAKGDAVQEGGSSYISLKAANKGNKPSFEGEWWGLVAKEGAAGAEGKEGKEGAAGGAGETKLTSFGPEAEVTLSEMKESMELVGYLVVGTMLGLTLSFYLYRILRAE